MERVICLFFFKLIEMSNRRKIYVRVRLFLVLVE